MSDKSSFLDQLDAAQISALDERTRSLNQLLSVLYDALEDSETSQQEKMDALLVLEAYIGRRVVPHYASLHPTPKHWKQFYLGVYPFGTKLRVKHSAKLAGSALKYRGAEGSFSYVSNGKVFIDFNDDKLNRGPLFEPDDLEAKS